MDIELGIQNVARTVTFSTEQSADEVNAAIADAVENGKTINLTDDKGRRIVVPAGMRRRELNLIYLPGSCRSGKMETGGCLPESIRCL